MMTSLKANANQKPCEIENFFHEMNNIVFCSQKRKNGCTKIMYFLFVEGNKKLPKILIFISCTDGAFLHANFLLSFFTLFISNVNKSNKAFLQKLEKVNGNNITEVKSAFFEIFFLEIDSISRVQ